MAAIWLAEMRQSGYCKRAFRTPGGAVKGAIRLAVAKSFASFFGQATLPRCSSQLYKEESTSLRTAIAKSNGCLLRSRISIARLFNEFHIAYA
jgi:hypothetical protein